MKVTNINLSRFIALTAFNKSCNEGALYKLDDSLVKSFVFYNWFNRDLGNYDKEFIEDKIKTCTMLDNNRDRLPKEYVIPSSILKVDNTTVGVTEPIINGYTVKEIFNREDISLSRKITILKKIGNLLNDMDDIRNNGIKNLYIGDVHSGNFMIDKNDNLKVIDIDSSTIFDSPIYSAKYLTYDSIARLKPTYYYDKNYMLIPNKNSDLHGYHMMILEMLFNDEFDDDDNLYFKYLDELKKTNVSKKLIDSFDRLTEKEDNTNPVEYLDSINEEVYNKCKKIINK
jgi:hypothetical protein